MNGKRLTVLLAAIAVCVPVLYIGTYAALVTRDEAFIEPFCPYSETYRLGGDAARLSFAPLNYVDRRIRPVYWYERGLDPWTPEGWGW